MLDADTPVNENEYTDNNIVENDNNNEQKFIIYAGAPADEWQEFARHEITYNGVFTPEDLAEALSGWIGLNFSITTKPAFNGIIIDWKSDASLFTGENTENYDWDEAEFHFFDVDSIIWFMLDSYWKSYQEIFGGDVYYTMDGGEELIFFYELSPRDRIPLNEPYMGLAYYEADPRVRGDEYIENDDYVKIISVTPNAFKFGERTEFTVEIQYNLISDDYAMLTIGLTDERSFWMMNPSSSDIIEFFPDDRIEVLYEGNQRITLTFTDELDQIEYRDGSVSELNGMGVAIMGFDYPVADYYELYGTK